MRERGENRWHVRAWDVSLSRISGRGWRTAPGEGLGPWSRPPSRASSLPRSSIQAAVGVRRPLPQNSGSSPGRSRSPVGAALAATPRLRAAGFDPGRCRGQKAPPTKPRLRPQVGRDPRGSGLGRDAAVAVRRLRSMPLSGSEDPSHRIPVPAPARAQSLWERPWPRRDRCRPRASIPVAIASTLAPTVFDSGRCRGRKTPPTTPRLRPRVGQDPLWERPWPRRGGC
jgi:hypothetical protein